jgi:hypothetical protein
MDFKEFENGNWNEKSRAHYIYDILLTTELILFCLPLFTTKLRKTKGTTRWK